MALVVAKNLTLVTGAVILSSSQRDIGAAIATHRYKHRTILPISIMGNGAVRRAVLGIHKLSAWRGGMVACVAIGSTADEMASRGRRGTASAARLDRANLALARRRSSTLFYQAGHR